MLEESEERNNNKRELFPHGLPESMTFEGATCVRHCGAVRWERSCEKIKRRGEKAFYFSRRIVDGSRSRSFFGEVPRRISRGMKARKETVFWVAAARLIMEAR